MKEQTKRTQRISTLADDRSKGNKDGYMKSAYKLNVLPSRRYEN
jgi:hypothetical protein